MKMPRRAEYGAAAKIEKVRVVVVLPEEEAVAIDAYGVPAGMPSRTATIRMLLKKGLEVAQKGGEPAVGQEA